MNFMSLLAIALMSQMQSGIVCWFLGEFKSVEKFGCKLHLGLHIIFNSDFQHCG